MWHRWWVAYARQRNAALVQDIARWSLHAQAVSNSLGQLKLAVMSRILDTARAYLCPMDGLASAPLPQSTPTIAIIDEAGTVPEFKIPHLVKLGVEAIVAIGDQNQLQPFTHIANSTPNGFFQRIVRVIGAPMLQVQYRMHPDISDLVSRQFYKGKLETAPHVAVLRKSIPDAGLRWFNYDQSDAESPDRSKKFNAVEVELITVFMQTKLDGLLAGTKSVAIITFYKSQFEKLMEAGQRAGYVRSDDEFKKLKKSKTPPANLTRFKHPNFRIVTVDAAQGSEADIVLLSCVRCNPKGELGFITNRNRLCVALSRARERLLIFGSRETLTRNPLWRAVWDVSLK